MSFVVALFNYISRTCKLWRRRILMKFFKTDKCSIREKLTAKVISIFLILTIIIAFIILLVVLHKSRNEYVREFKFQVGWWKTAVISVSVLDQSEHVNFPEVEDGRGGEESVEKYLQKTQNDSVIWKVEGFTKYVNTFRDLNESGEFDNFTKSYNNSGFWVFSYGPNENKSWKASAIRGFKITEHLTKASGVPVENLEVAVAIKAFVEGEAGIVVRFEDSLTNKFHLDEMDFKDGFCYKILNVPFDKRINTIYIRPTSTNLRERGLVIIDHVIVVVSMRNTAESIIHTLVPANWC